MTGAALWDLDGTLVDSAEYHWRAWRDTMAAEGAPITHQQFLQTFGLRNDSIIRQWLGPGADAQRIERIGEAKEERYRALVRSSGMAPLPGAAEWVERLRGEGWLQAIASSGPRRNLEVVLEAIGLADCFQALVSAEDVKIGKPDPQVFLVAASRLNMPPSRCVVVEDAPAGVEAARRAGMRSIALARPGASLEADIVVPSLDALPPDAFAKLLAGIQNE